MPGLFVVAVGMSIAVAKFVGPAAQGVAYLLIALAVGFGCIFWLFTGRVW